MNKMVEACLHCANMFGCYADDFKRCPRIDAAAEGLGIPVSHKEPSNSEWIKHIPFGVFQGMKHLANKTR